MNKDQLLSIFYEQFLKALPKNGDKSVLLYFMSQNEKTRVDILNRSSINISYENFSSDDINDLLRELFIVKTEKPNTYCITSRGIFEQEKKLELISTYGFLDSLQEKYFNVAGTNEKLTAREKTVCIMLIYTRSFSQESSMNIEGDNSSYIDTKWLEIYNRCDDLLEKNNLLRNITNNNTRGESSISDIMRHTNRLSIKIQNIYKAPRNHSYYLDLLDKNGNLDIDKTSFVLKKVIDIGISIDNIREIKKFITKNLSNITNVPKHNDQYLNNFEINLDVDKSIDKAFIEAD